MAGLPVLLCWGLVAEYCRRLLSRTMDTLGNALTGRDPEALSEILTATKEGGKVAALFGGTGLGVNTAITRLADGSHRPVENHRGRGYNENTIDQLYGKREVRFSEMTEEELDKIIEEYRIKAPIDIHQTAKTKARSMTSGYEQISYEWRAEGYKYEVRWHTRTPGAPKDQKNTWVIQRTLPGNGGQKATRQFFIEGNLWVEGWKWYGAIEARKEGNASKAQVELLDHGHWKEK